MHAKKKGSVGMTSSTASLERLSAILGWDREVCASIINAMSKSHSEDEIRSIAHDFGIDSNSAAKQEVERYIQTRNFETVPVISDEDLKAALYMGDNVKTTVKRRSARSSSTRTLEKKVVNCLNCGKVYDCRQPGKDATLFLSSGGVCTYCGKRVRLVYSDGWTNMDLESTNPAAEEDESSTLTSAKELRDRLLEYDRQSARRTKVIDDQSDYFEIDSNTWLTDEERADLRRQQQKAEAAEEQRRNKMVVTLDLLGRRVLMDEDKAKDDIEVLNREEHVVERAMNATRAEAAYGGGTAAKLHQGMLKMTVNPSMRDAKYVFVMPPGKQKEFGKKVGQSVQNDSFSRVQHDGESLLIVFFYLCAYYRDFGSLCPYFLKKFLY